MFQPYRKHVTSKSNNKKRGRGLLNSLINKLPFELHIPGYNFCGPGTKLEKRLLRGDKGINLLDEACKEHDIAYLKSNDIKSRHIADQLLSEKAIARFKDKNASFGEKSAALGVGSIMKVKRKFGMGLKRKRVKGLGITLSQAIAQARKGIKGKKFKRRY